MASDVDKAIALLDQNGGDISALSDEERKVLIHLLEINGATDNPK